MLSSLNRFKLSSSLERSGRRSEARRHNSKHRYVTQSSETNLRPKTRVRQHFKRRLRLNSVFKLSAKIKFTLIMMCQLRLPRCQHGVISADREPSKGYWYLNTAPESPSRWWRRRTPQARRGGSLSAPTSTRVVVHSITCR